MKKIIAVIMMIMICFSMTATAFAAEGNESRTNDTLSTRGSIFYDSSSFNSYYYKTFTVSSSGYTTFVYTIGGNTNQLMIVVNNTDNGNSYLIDTFNPSGTAKVSHATIPAGHYEVYMTGTGTYYFALNFYR